jgi:hypothetical protein
MPHLSFWVLTFLLGWNVLNAVADSPEGSHALSIEKPVAVPVEPIFGFVYMDPKKEITRISKYNKQVLFNSKGSSNKIAYDSKSGELIISVAGTYEAIYSLTAINSDLTMALTVNGKVIEQSTIFVTEVFAGNHERNLNFFNTTAPFVLKLAKGDRVGLSLSTGFGSIEGRAKELGNIASLFLSKL